MRFLSILTMALAMLFTGLRLAHGQQAQTLPPPRFITTSTILPSRLSGLSAVYDGQDSIYVMGGYQPRVWRYNVSSGALWDIGSTPGLAMGYGGLALRGSDLWYFGGWNLTTEATNTPLLLSSVISFSIPSGNHSQVAELTSAMDRVAVGWDPRAQSAYLVRSAEVLRFDGHQVDRVGRFVEVRNQPAAVWTPAGDLYAFGGHGNYYSSGREIHRYNASGRTMDLLPQTLPTVVKDCTTLVGVDGVYLITGTQGLVKFNTSSLLSELIPVTGYPAANYAITDTACAYVPKQGRIYLFGGVMSGATTDEVYYIDLGPRAAPLPSPPSPAPGPTPTPAPTPAPAQNCTDGTIKVIPDPNCCDTFLLCNNGSSTKHSCPAAYQFNPSTFKCEPASIVGCALTFGP